ncbi:MAG: hypothetical protein ABJE47_21450 [bacterium]
MLRQLLMAPLVLLAYSGYPAALRTTNSGGRPPAAVISLRNGKNDVDLLGNRTKGEVFVARRSNYNAHGHSSVAFYVFGKSDLGDSKGEWQVVPFFAGPRDGESSRELIGTSEGADCILSDIRLLRHEHAPVEVVIANRALDKSYADPAAVTFDYYTLTFNESGAVGWPTYYFKYSRTTRAGRPYCDVNDAFQRELGLGTNGVGHGDG